MLEVASGGVSWARVRVSRVLSTIGKGCFAVGLSGFYLVTAAAGADRVMAILGGTMAIAWAAAFGALLASFILWFARTPRPAKLAVDGDSLVVTYPNQSRVVPLAQVASAYVVQRPALGGFVPTIEIALANGDLLAARVDTFEQARAFASALGFGAGGKRVTIALDAPSRRLYHLLLGFAAYQVGSLVAMPFIFLFAFLAGGGMSSHPTFGMASGAVIGPAALLAYHFLEKLLRTPTLVVGEDGVAYTAGLTKRFVPRSAITAVEQQHASAPLVVHTIAGGPIVVNASVLDPQRRTAAAQLAYERFVATPRGAEPPAAFGREGRSVAAWRAHLRGLFDAGGYRTAGTSVDDAAAVLKNANATPEQRIGAALALRVAGEPPEKIRVAAESSADERVRVALEAVAESEDDPKIEKALKRLP